MNCYMVPLKRERGREGHSCISLVETGQVHTTALEEQQCNISVKEKCKIVSRSHNNSTTKRCCRYNTN